MATGQDRTALLFPGQGSPLDGEAELVARFAPELGELAAELTGTDPFAGASSSTRLAQPAIYCAGIARWIGAGRPEPDCMAGHSLGELTALAAAGSWSLEDGLRVVCERGRSMEEASEPSETMLALRADAEQAAEIALAAGVVVANDNAPGQQVLSGSRSDLERAERLAGERGSRSMLLPVAGAFHSPSMSAAVGPFRLALADLPPAPPRLPVVSSGSARPFGSDIAAELVAALTSPVRWRELSIGLTERGVRRFVEVGPGKVLSGLVRRTVPEADVSVLEPLPAGVAGG